jgi:hypothetical protein
VGELGRGVVVDLVADLDLDLVEDKEEERESAVMKCSSEWRIDRCWQIDWQNAWLGGGRSA